jgi:hypothetical protein
MNKKQGESEIKKKREVGRESQKEAEPGRNSQIQCCNTFKLYKVTLERTLENALALRVGYREKLPFHVSFGNHESSGKTCEQSMPRMRGGVGCLSMPPCRVRHQHRPYT